MAQQSFISFHDLTPDGSYLYATPSVQQVLGYHPSEMVGRSAYDFFFPAEIPACKALHLETISLQKVAVVTTLRMRHRAGHFVKASIVSNLISGCIVASVCLATDSEALRAREMTSQEVHVIEANGVVVSKQWSRHRLQPAPAEPARWADAVAAFSEIRSCLLLDRFTAGLTCVYATASLADVLETPGAPDAIINRSILDWIHPQCRESVMTEVGRAKSMDGICHVRFATIGAVYGGADVEVEVVMQCCSDAILAIVRPFANQSIHQTRELSAPLPAAAASARGASADGRSRPLPPTPHLPPPVPTYVPGRSLVVFSSREAQLVDFPPGGGDYEDTLSANDTPSSSPGGGDNWSEWTGDDDDDVEVEDDNMSVSDEDTDRRAHSNNSGSERAASTGEEYPLSPPPDYDTHRQPPRRSGYPPTANGYSYPAPHHPYDMYSGPSRQPLPPSPRAYAYARPPVPLPACVELAFYARDDVAGRRVLEGVPHYMYRYEASGPPQRVSAGEAWPGRGMQPPPTTTTAAVPPPTPMPALQQQQQQQQALPQCMDSVAAHHHHHHHHHRPTSSMAPEPGTSDAGDGPAAPVGSEPRWRASQW